jgi:voltage-gated potassium channel
VAKTARAAPTTLSRVGRTVTEPLLENDSTERRRDRSLRALCRALYHGHSVAAVRFRTAWIVFDLAVIAFFIATPLLRDNAWFLTIDYALAAILSVDLIARAIACNRMTAFFKRPIVWVDLLVLSTLLFPGWGYSLAFLRALRIWTLFNSEVFWDTVGRRWDDTRVEEIVRALASLVTFLFVVTGFVYTGFVGRTEGLNTYIDALYFTVTSLTTTGYGDILLPGTEGRLVSIVTMLVGITLFVRLAQALLVSHKVRHPCPTCGLVRHDPDAVHCKACGTLLCIRNEQP